MSKPTAFWVTDSGGKESLHLNGSGLSKEASYLGHIERDGKEWFFVDKEKHGPYDTYAQAKRAAMKVAGVEYL